jgi:hypothetical protein
MRAPDGWVSLVEKRHQRVPIYVIPVEILFVSERLGSAGITVWSISVIGAADSFPG